jgi:hypothetical protein
VRLSANSARPARRSNDRHAILDLLPATREPGSDLRFRGAPLRNRTVDLLLTIHTSPGSPSGKHLPQRRQQRLPDSRRGQRHHRSRDHQAGREAASGHGLSAHRMAASAEAGVPLRPGSWCRVPASRGRADGQMTVKRSSTPCPACPEDRGEQEVCPPQGRCEPVLLSDPG